MKAILVMFIAATMILSLAAVSAQDNLISPNANAGAKSNASENQNRGIGSNLSEEIGTRQELYRAGNYTISMGKFLNVKVLSADFRELKLGEVIVKTDMNLSIENDEKNNTHMKAYLNNGNDLEIKTMPDTASATALTRLRLKVCNESNNCTITLKETGVNNENKAQYELRAEKDMKVLGLFNAKMHVEAQIDAATGEIIKEKVPWWSAISTTA